MHADVNLRERDVLLRVEIGGELLIGQKLVAHGILWAPDFVVNAGGLINVAAELEPGGYDAERTRERVAEIEDVMADILAEAESRKTTPLAAAVGHARRRLDAV